MALGLSGKRVRVRRWQPHRSSAAQQPARDTRPTSLPRYGSVDETDGILQSVRRAERQGELGFGGTQGDTPDVSLRSVCHPVTPEKFLIILNY